MSDDLLFARVELEFASRLRDMLCSVGRGITAGTTEAGELKARIRAVIADYNLADKSFRTRHGTDMAVRAAYERVYGSGLPASELKKRIEEWCSGLHYYSICDEWRGDGIPMTPAAVADAIRDDMRRVLEGLL